jgi:hypothetical protein
MNDSNRTQQKQLEFSFDICLFYCSDAALRVSVMDGAVITDWE